MHKGLDPCPSLIGTYNSCSYLPKALSKGASCSLHLPSAFLFCDLFPTIFSPAARLRRWEHHAVQADFLFFREVGEWVGGSFESEFLDNCWAPKHLAGAQELVFLINEHFACFQKARVRSRPPTCHGKQAVGTKLYILSLISFAFSAT